MKRRGYGWWCWICSLVLVACGGDADSEHGSAAAAATSLGTYCTSSSTCGAGLYCAGENSLAENACTADCTGDQVCDQIFTGAFCQNLNCVKPCSIRSDCGAGSHCEPSYRQDFCQSGPARLSHSCSSDADCDTGLQCGKAGEQYAGYCTAACTGNEDCPNGYCSGTFCAHSCDTSLDDCASGLVCRARNSWSAICAPKSP
jgi:hypothetical protein